jgi:hypothetical protein
MRGGFEEVNHQAAWLAAGDRVPTDDEEDRAECYRQTAERLRQFAAQIRFDFGRQRQLLSLADAFDRLADRVEVLPD